jgi:hypothetical protein
VILAQTYHLRNIEMLANRCLAQTARGEQRATYLRQALDLALQLHRRFDEAACLLSLASVTADDLERETLWATAADLLRQCDAADWLSGHSPDNPPFLPLLL